MKKIIKVWNRCTLYTYTVNTQEKTIIILNTRTAKANVFKIESPIKYADDVRNLIDKNMI